MPDVVRYFEQKLRKSVSNIVLVIGGTGAMGSAIVRALLADCDRAVRVLTRDPTSPRMAQQLDGGDGRVAAVRGDLDDENGLRAAMTGIDAVVCNTDFWSTASPLREYEQGLRALRAAQSAGVGHFVWSSLDNAIGLSDGEIAVPHYDSKAAVEGWIGLMRSDEFMRQEPDGWFSRHVSVLVTAPYYQNFQMRVLPKPGRLADGRDGLVFGMALGAGRYPLVSLEDIGWFARYLIDNLATWGGRTLRVAGDSLSGAEIAATFERVTGIAAEYRDVPLNMLRAAMPGTGHDVAGMFEFFQAYDVMGRARDIDLLRHLHPGLLSFAAWLEATGWRGEQVEVQKLAVQLPH